MVALKSETEIQDGEPEAPVKKKAKPAAKKGNRSWAPAAPLGLKSRDLSNRLRWVHTEAANVLRKKAEGWVPASAGDAVHDRPHGVESGDGLPAGILEYRDSILMKMPEELALARDRYYRDRAGQQLSGITGRAKRKIRDATGVAVDGEITID
tara:strand:+ start:137 stop:595 length:459 start_codon:yes stop_codon:yes gene_type:complete